MSNEWFFGVIEKDFLFIHPGVCEECAHITMNHHTLTWVGKVYAVGLPTIRSLLYVWVDVIYGSFCIVLVLLDMIG